MRLLMSYRAAKFKQQAKIKSKQYHRIKKRQRRRQLIKEIEELMARDPEAAKEKLKELEVDRAYERATLKHRGTNKWSKQIRQFATRNPELRKLMQEHLKFGRELKGKHGVKGSDESSSDDTESAESDAEDKPLTVGEIVELAAEQAYRESKEVAIPSASQDPELKKSLKALRKERKKILRASKIDAAGSTTTEWAVEDDDAAPDTVATQKSLEELAAEAIRAETEKAAKAAQNEEGENRK
ncbi:Utp14 protein, partial [Aphelenchoides avenae]